MQPIATDRPPLPELTVSHSNEQGHAWINLIKRLIVNKAKISTVIDKANKIVDQIMEADVKPHLTCKRGCSYCCHIPVGLTECEALYIQEKSGVRANLKQAKPLTIEENNGAPCTFLINNECSIYEYRPFACRVFGSFDDPEINCKISSTLHYTFAITNPHEPGHGSVINWLVFTTIIGLGNREKRTVIKDIRQFFPK